MNKIFMKLLTNTTFLAGSLFISSNAMAITNFGISPGIECQAYHQSQAENLKPDWNSVEASGTTWTLCPISSLFSVQVDRVGFGLELPVDGTNDVYNCYVAEQSASGVDTASRKVVWSIGSGAGTTAVELLTAGTFDFDDFDDLDDLDDLEEVLGAVKTYTAGCQLKKNHKLHSIVVVPGEIGA